LSPILGLAFQNFGTKVRTARPNMHGAQIALVPRSMPCFRCMRRLDPLHYFPNFYFYMCLSVLKMYWVVVTADCRNSVCQKRVCRNSVCLPQKHVYEKEHEFVLISTETILALIQRCNTHVPPSKKLHTLSSRLETR